MNGSSYDDFEFYDLSFRISETEPVTLDPPLKVAWTYKFPWRLIHGIPEVEIFAADGILYLYDSIEGNLIVMNAETGELLWDKQLDGLGVSLEYKDGVLFVVNSTTIDALNAKNAEILWSYPGICWEWGDSLIFGILCLPA